VGLCPFPLALVSDGCRPLGAVLPGQVPPQRPGDGHVHPQCPPPWPSEFPAAGAGIGGAPGVQQNAGRPTKAADTRVLAGRRRLVYMLSGDD
jgi:hypothetical protein